MTFREFFIIASILLSSPLIAGLSPEVIQKIANQIWQNEAAGSQELLVFWSEKESFPSLGIGHNIWFPEGQEIKYTHGFPLLCNYLKEQHIKLPEWLQEALKKGAPWKTREEFYNDNARIQELRQILVGTIALQAQYMINQLVRKLPEIINAAPIESREKIAKNLELMQASPLGMYTLVDYLNFKGDGLNPKEEVNGYRWGMLSVLLDMPTNLTQENVTKAFAVAAAKRLIMLIEHSPNDYASFGFLSGWVKRLNTYRDYGLMS